MNEVSQDKKLSRREFIKLVRGVGAAIGAVVAEKAISDLASTQPSLLSVTNGEAPPNPLLQQTATAVAANNETTSFVPEGEFDKEFFETVRNSTFLIEIYKHSADGQDVASQGTAWLAKKDGDTYFLVTNRHVADPKDMQITEITLTRPNVDPYGHGFAPNYNCVYSDEFDIAVIKCEGNLPPSAIPLDYEELAPIDANTNLLIVGFPQDFINGRDIFTMGEAVRTDRPITPDGKLPSYILNGLINHGSSGSPVVMSSEGKPRVIGMVRAMQPGQVFIVPLVINKLIESFDKKTSS